MQDTSVVRVDLSAIDHNMKVLRRIVGAAEGNPFFLEEMVAIVDGGDANVPATIQAVLAARLDRLPLEERRVLETAAVEATTLLTLTRYLPPLTTSARRDAFCARAG